MKSLRVSRDGDSKLNIYYSGLAFCFRLSRHFEHFIMYLKGLAIQRISQLYVT